MYAFSYLKIMLYMPDIMLCFRIKIKKTHFSCQEIAKKITIKWNEQDYRCTYRKTLYQGVHIFQDLSIKVWVSVYKVVIIEKHIQRPKGLR